MKTKNTFKSHSVLLLALCILASSALHSFAHADETSPSEFSQNTDGNAEFEPQAQEAQSPGQNSLPQKREGTETELTPAQIAEMKKWAVDSKSNLETLLDEANALSPHAAEKVLLTGINNVVLASYPNYREMLMRYALNRGIETVERLEKEVHRDTIARVRIANRILIRTIGFSLNYYESEVNRIGEHQVLPYADFGDKYAQFLLELDESVLDAQAQYAIARTALGYLHVDLKRDEKWQEFAPAIDRLLNFLKITPAELSVADCLRSMPILRKTYDDAIRVYNDFKNRAENAVRVQKQAEQAAAAQALAAETARVKKIADDEKLEQKRTADAIASEKAVALAAITEANRIEAERIKKIHDAKVPKLALGEMVFAKHDNGAFYYARINGLQVGGGYVVGFPKDAGGDTPNRSRESIAITRGGISGFHVGDRVFRVNAASAERAYIVAVLPNDNFVLELKKGGFEGDVPYTALGMTSGCLNEVCVGKAYFNVPRKAAGTVTGYVPGPKPIETVKTDEAAAVTGATSTATAGAAKDGKSAKSAASRKAAASTKSSSEPKIPLALKTADAGKAPDGHYIMLFKDGNQGGFVRSDLASTNLIPEEYTTPVVPCPPAPEKPKGEKVKTDTKSVTTAPKKTVSSAETRAASVAAAAARASAPASYKTAFPPVKCTVVKATAAEGTPAGTDSVTGGPAKKGTAKTATTPPTHAAAPEADAVTKSETTASAKKSVAGKTATSSGASKSGVKAKGSATQTAASAPNEAGSGEVASGEAEPAAKSGAISKATSKGSAHGTTAPKPKPAAKKEANVDSKTSPTT